jgi:outer membrane protein assembly factor BamB
VRRRRRAFAIFISLSVGLTTAGGGAAGAAAQWITYHADNSRSGVDNTEPSLDPLRPAWTSRLDGAAVFGQPVVADGRVFVGTEDDDVYALDAHDGRILWQASIGQPLVDVVAQVGCGDIDPLGITSTPVVDTARSTVFVVGEVSTGGAGPVRHLLVGFNVYSGAETLRALADPPGLPADQLLHMQQRAALALGNGRVYVGFGGLAGDCGTYHGWVVGVPETGTSAAVEFNATPNGTGGAVWNGGGGPSIDSAGDLYVTTGNPNSGANGYSESAVKLDPNLDTPPLAQFRDPAASGDQDLGSGDAVLLPNGELFTAGKTEIGYVLAQSNLAKIGASIPALCGSDPDGGAAYLQSTNTAYVPCLGGGIQQVNLTTHTLGWHKGAANGAPIIVDGNLWAVSYPSGTLEELSPADGHQIQETNVGDTVPHFTSPSAADGLLLVGTDHGIAAFSGPSGPPPPAPPPLPPTAGYWQAAADGGVFSFGTAAFHGSLGGVHLTAPIIGMAPTPDGKGYWLVGSDGGVFGFGDARFYGSTGGIRLAQPVVGIAAAPKGLGYWLVARDGGVFGFGPTARFYGSMGGARLARPVVGIAADPATGGYWLVASDGGIFGFHAAFYGSAGGVHLSQPVVGMAPATGGGGYWMVASDGGIFTFGPETHFFGSTGGVPLIRPMVGMGADAATGGYWTVASDGGVFSFHAPFEGSTGGVPLVSPIVSVAPAG